MFHTFLSKFYHKKGFTLIELIVVITIFVVLSTISFITYTNMLSDARNSTRKVDMSEMKVRLRGIAQKIGAFPLPTNPITLSNSGVLAVNQGWSDSIETDNGSSFQVDPKSNKPYRYSTTIKRQGYQIGMTFEMGSDTYSSFIDGDFTPIAPYVFPSLFLATTQTGVVEIHDSIGSGSINRTQFIINKGTLNLPYDMMGNPIASATSFSGILDELGVKQSWTSNYSSCQNIYEGGKSMGPGEYLIIDNTGAVVLTSCVMNPPTY